MLGTLVAIMELNNDLVKLIEPDLETIRSNLNRAAKVLQVDRIQLAFKKISSLNILLWILNLKRKEFLSLQACDRDASYFSPRDTAG